MAWRTEGKVSRRQGFLRAGFCIILLEVCPDREGEEGKGDRGKASLPFLSVLPGLARIGCAALTSLASGPRNKHDPGTAHLVLITWEVSTAALPSFFSLPFYLSPPPPPPSFFLFIFFFNPLHKPGQAPSPSLTLSHPRSRPHAHPCHRPGSPRGTERSWRCIPSLPRGVSGPCPPPWAWVFPSPPPFRCHCSRSQPNLGCGFKARRSPGSCIVLRVTYSFLGVRLCSLISPLLRSS